MYTDYTFLMFSFKTHNCKKNIDKKDKIYLFFFFFFMYIASFFSVEEEKYIQNYDNPPKKDKYAIEESGL